MTFQELFKAAKEKALEVKALLADDAPDMKQVEALQEEYKSLLARAQAMKEADAALKDIEEPQLPAALPMDADPDPNAPDEKDIKAKAMEGFYLMRYGSIDDAVRAVLTDLHGPNYEERRWMQWKAFNRYLRRVNQAPSGEDQKLLSQIIFSPTLAKQAIQEGIPLDALKATMVEAQDALGGYVVPVDFQAKVIERLMGFVVVRKVATRIDTSRDRVEFPKATGGGSQYTSAVRGTWVEETPTASTAETNLTFGMEAIPIHTYMASTPISRNLLEDAAFNLADYLATKLAEASAIDEDNAFLVGDGVGKPQGILPDGSNGLSLTCVPSGNASALTYDGIIELTYGIDSQYRALPSCAFVGEKDTYKDIALMKDGEGRYMWDRAERQTKKLEGYPVQEQEAMPSVGSGTYPLIFGDFSGYVIADRVGMTVERFIDATTARQNVVYYVMRRRLGGQCVESWRFGVQYVGTSCP